jgi:DNA anti-recombination protein RmuC
MSERLKKELEERRARLAELKRAKAERLAQLAQTDKTKAEARLSSATGSGHVVLELTCSL